MTNLSVRESVIYSREGRRAGIRESRPSAFGQMDRKICLGLYKAGRTACLPPVFAVGSKRNVCFIVFLLFFLSAKGFNQTKKMRFRHVLSPFSSCFGSGRSHRRFNLRRTFFPFGCKRKIAFSRKNRIYAVMNCIYAVWMYFYSITPFFSGL